VGEGAWSGYARPGGAGGVSPNSAFPGALGHWMARNPHATHSWWTRWTYYVRLMNGCSRPGTIVLRIYGARTRPGFVEKGGRAPRRSRGRQAIGCWNYDDRCGVVKHLGVQPTALPEGKYFPGAPGHGQQGLEVGWAWVLRHDPRRTDHTDQIDVTGETGVPHCLFYRTTKRQHGVF